MNSNQPVLKPAVQVGRIENAIHLAYCGQQLSLQHHEARYFDTLRAYLDAGCLASMLAGHVDIDRKEVQWLLKQLDRAHILIEGERSGSGGGRGGVRTCFLAVRSRIVPAQVAKLISLFEIQTLWRWNVIDYYNENSVFGRVSR